MQTSSGDNRISGLIAILGLVALLVGLIIMLLLPDIRLAAWGILLAGIALLAASFVMDYQRVGRAFTSRRGRFGTAATVMVSVFIGIIIIVNAISVSNYHRFDATGVAQFTLTSQTKDVLNELDTPVKAICFFTPVDPFGIDSYITNLLSEYQNYTDQLTVESIDPDEHPDQARQYNIQIYSTVVFESENRQRQVGPQDILLVSTDQEGNQQIAGVEAEHAFTSAILEVTGIVQKKVYFLTGHGEDDITTNYSYVREGLLDNLYKVGLLDLLIERSIPEDCTALIIAGPQTSLNESEIEIIQDYLENDGWVMVLTNPDSPQGIKQLLSYWDIDIEDGTIIDPSSYVNPSMDNPSVPRTRNMFGLSTTYFPGATALIPQPGYEPSILVGEEGLSTQIIWTSEDSDLVMYSLCRTSQDSWLEKNFKLGEEPEFNEEIEKKDALNIGFLIVTTQATESELKGPRLLVYGDSDFASNQHYRNVDNGALFLNSVELLTLGKELISIERKVLPFRRLIVSSGETSFIQISSIGLLPLLVLIIGGIIWWRRR
jgi:hypothetical protein